ncbi:hypothetical protein [Lederbergia galactosidilytica]|uniref:hypothetical protein n=1 Tax=Lederbergia galactosidilytica TaxID=217031 RepID=UPI000A73E26A|nr:hypothetical protein [Lederbergia galactosidilytica]MBP1914593.1 hypothetical protein [Lederbergia galactosidilytica]
MTNKLTEFEKISKALQSTYHLLDTSKQYSPSAIEGLKEAEDCLNKAIDYTLFDRKYN